MSTPTTALMPLDPTASPQRVNRILPIRANLLPTEITAGRNARRTRLFLAAVVMLVIAVLGAWYLYADQRRDQTADELAAVTAQVDLIRGETSKEQYTKVTDAINDAAKITTQLKGTLADDLPWNTLLDSIRATGSRRQVTTINGTLATKTTPATKGPNLGTLTIVGTGRDKRTVAGFVEALSEVDGIAGAYLTVANQSKDGVTFTLTADIVGTARCGRFTTKCTSGGN